MGHVGWYPRRRGILEHLERGKVSLLDTAIHDFLCLTADYRTGLAWGSAEKIRALCPAGISLRSIQRSLAKQEEISWLKTFRTRGRRGNYPLLLNRYFVRDASGKWWAVNCERTTDWRDIQYDPVTDPTLGVNRGDAESDSEGATEGAGELTPIQEEVRKETQEARSKNEALTLESSGLRIDTDADAKNQRTEKQDQKLDEVFEDWDTPPDNALEIGPDMYASLYVDTHRIGYSCAEFRRSAELSWRRAWQSIAAGEIPLDSWLSRAIEEAKNSKLSYLPVFKKRIHELERGELRVRATHARRRNQGVLGTPRR